MPHETEMGRVHLVGAGPGSADLLTLRAARAIASAEALLYDALVSDDVLALAPAGCFRIQTGKRAGRASMDQGTINLLMLRLAKRGLTVVRLKGGDPSVFGRVGEEQHFLQLHNVPHETVPGITALSAAAAQFDFPLTHRGVARRIVMTTARVEEGAIVGDWSAAADREATLAIYMGGEAAPAVRDRLIAAGRSPTTPAIAVENVGRPESRLYSGDLGSLPEMIAERGGGPLLIVVGEVAAMAAGAQCDLEFGALHAVRR